MRASVSMGALAVVAAISLAVPVGYAQADAPVEVLAKLFFKIATYDANLPKEVLRVGIVYPKKDAAAGEAAAGAFGGLSAMKVNGRAIEIASIAFGKAQDIAQAVQAKPFYGLFILSGTNDTEIDAIRGLAKQHGIFTFSQDVRHVDKGITVGISTDGGKRTIVMNITAATEQGRKFDGGFIAACKVVR